MRVLVIVALCLALTPAPGIAGGPSTATRFVLAPIDSLWVNQHWSRAVALVDSLIPSARATADSSLLAHLLCRRGNFLVARGAIAPAAAPLEEALQLAEALTDSVALCTSLRWLSLVEGQLGTRASTEAILNRLIRTAQACADRPAEGWGHIGMGYQAWIHGEPEVALDHYSAAAELFHGTADINGTLWANNGMATVQAERGMYQDALTSYRRTLDQARAHKQPGAEAHALNNLGTLEFSLGRDDAALEYYRQALALFRSMGRLQDQPTPMHNIALCLTNLGQAEDARQMLADALRISEKIGSQALIVGSRQHLAENLLNAGRLADAAREFETLLEESRDLSPLDRCDALVGLANIDIHNKDYDSAIKRLARAREETRGGQDHFRALQAMGLQGRALREAGRLTEALTLNRRVVQLARDAGIQNFVVDGLTETAECHLALEHPDSALACFETAAAEWEKARKLLLSPRWREQRGKQGRHIFPNLVHLLWAKGDHAAAWDRLQAYKARTLLERMMGPGHRFEDMMAAGATSTIGLQEFRENILQPRDLMLDFALGSDHSVAMAVTRDSMRLITLPSRAKIDGRVNSFHELLSDPETGSPAALETVSNNMATLVLGDLRGMIAGSKRVVVCPDGTLNLIPFELLPLVGGASSDKKEESEPLWNRTPSATILAMSRQFKGNASEDPLPLAWTILAIAGDQGQNGEKLRGTHEEVRWLDRTFRGVTTAPAGLEDPEALITLLDGKDLLHVASHTKINDQSPWQTAVTLNRDTGWRAETIAGLDLTPRLVVLSSCSTAGGRVISGEGVMGLTAAFISAGVPTVVSSLWPVDDVVTRDFMKAFYRTVATGNDVSGSLATARAAIRRNPRTAHPCYWAGFVVSGDGGLKPDLKTRTATTSRLAWGLGLLGLVILAFSFIRKPR